MAIKKTLRLLRPCHLGHLPNSFENVANYILRPLPTNFETAAECILNVLPTNFEFKIPTTF